jgi:hypothetical protein
MANDATSVDAVRNRLATWRAQAQARGATLMAPVGIPQTTAGSAPQAPFQLGPPMPLAVKQPRGVVEGS